MQVEEIEKSPHSEKYPDSEKLSPSETEFAKYEDKKYDESAEKVEEDFTVWVQVIGGFMIAMNTWGLITSYGVFQSFYTFELLRDYTPSDLSWIGTIQASLLMTISIFSEKAFRMGFYPVLLYVGSCLTVVGIISLSFCTTYWHIFLSHGICVGIGSGLLCVPTFTLIDSSFSTNRTLANGIVASGIGIGGIMYPLTFHLLVPSIGFAWSVRVIASIVLTTLAIAIVTLQTGKTYISDNEGQVSNLPKSSSINSIPFTLFCFGEFFQFLGYFCPIFYTPLLAQEFLSVPRRKSFYLLLIGNGASIPGRIIVSYVALRLGVVGPFAVLAFLSGTTTLAWQAVSDFNGAVTFGSFNGFIFGASLALPAMVIPVLCPSPDMMTRSSRSAISNIFAAFGVLFGCPVAGFLSEKFMPGPQALQLFSGSSILFGAMFQVFAWRISRRRKW